MTAQNTARAVRFDGNRVARDMALKGWLATDLARAANVSDMTITRFLRGDVQTPRVAKKLAGALGFPLRRYLVEVAAA